MPTRHLKLSQLLMSIMTLFILGTLSLAAKADDGEIITYYQRPFPNKIQPGWRYLWNAKGKIGNSKNYVPLTYDKGHMKAIGDSGKMRLPWLGSLRGTKNDIPRYAITAYTVSSDKNSDVWLTKGNIYVYRGVGVNLKVYLNDTLKLSTVVKREGRVPHLFQCNFGEIKKGDTIYVAVGPANVGYNYYRIRYNVVHFPSGKKPDAPVNMISLEATEASPRFDKKGSSASYIRRHKLQCENALRDHSKLILLGDSITAGLRHITLGRYKPANFGLGGDSMQNVLWRIENGVFDKLKPKVIVLLIGTNNIAGGFSVDEVSAGINAIVKALRQKTPESKILLMGIFPRGRSIHNNGRYEKIKKVNANISKLADTKNIIYLDIADKLVEKDGSISKKVFPDGLHLSKKGLLIWADAMIPILDKL